MNKLKNYLVSEINIEFKACLYFFAILFFVCCYYCANGVFNVPILHMAEMILLTYVMGYVQVYLLGNFEEAEALNLRNFLYCILCSCIYSIASYVFHWFDKSISMTIAFFFYVLLCFLCMFLIYKVRRDIETEQLNNDLNTLKKALEEGVQNNE